jgi:hypothetical protein
MNFIKVDNDIYSITSKGVEFYNPAAGQNALTFLLRVHNKKTIWKLLPDGIYVRKEFVEAYKLNLAK